MARKRQQPTPPPAATAAAIEVTRVRISRGFWLGQHEVTQGQWEAVMGSNPSFFDACGLDCPVEEVSWEDAQEFIRRLNAMDGVGTYRLPTEERGPSLGLMEKTPKEESLMPFFEFTLTEFKFPKKLPNDKANFRLIADLRLINGKKQLITEHAVMPSLDTFWECATDKEEEPNYVRGSDDGAYGQLDLTDNGPIDEWDRLILIVKGENVHSIQFKVIDVDRKDAWDTAKNFLGGIIEAFIGKIKDVLPKNLPSPVSGSLGGAADDLNSFLLKKLAGGDKVLFRGSTQLTPPKKWGHDELHSSRTWPGRPWDTRKLPNRIQPDHQNRECIERRDSDRRVRCLAARKVGRSVLTECAGLNPAIHR